MADDTPTTSLMAWKTAAATYDTASNVLLDAETARLFADEDCDAAEIAMLNTPAPNFAAVITKLETMWIRNFGMVSDPYVDAQRLMIADIKRLAPSFD